MLQLSSLGCVLVLVVGLKTLREGSGLIDDVAKYPDHCLVSVPDTSLAGHVLRHTGQQRGVTWRGLLIRRVLSEECLHIVLLSVSRGGGGRIVVSCALLLFGKGKQKVAKSA